VRGGERMRRMREEKEKRTEDTQTSEATSESISIFSVTRLLSLSRYFLGLSHSRIEIESGPSTTIR
jgi:hypothetical protein